MEKKTENVHMKYIDEIINVTDRDSFNLAAALRIAEHGSEDDVIVFIVCDTGERYLSKFLSDEWMKEKRLLGFERMTVGLINQLKSDDSTPHLVSVGPEHKIGDAIQMMKAYGLSQLPVLEEGKS